VKSREQMIEDLVRLKRKISMFRSEVGFDTWTLKDIELFRSEVVGTIEHLIRLRDQVMEYTTHVSG